MESTGLVLDALGRVRKMVRNAISDLTPQEMQYSPLSTLSVRLASVINCNTRHAGQIEYLRGLVKYGGWFPSAEKRSGG
jgi:hypothetical protein